jgi:ribosome biogenesis GTPase / thiamine phosphate phosphatase
MRRRKAHREKDLTRKYLDGGYASDEVETNERFSARSKHAEQNKILKTAQLRAGQEGVSEDLATLPVGQVVQVFSLFYEIEQESQRYLCTSRKTLSRTSDTQIVVGDHVRFRPGGTMHETGLPEGVIEQVLERRSLLTRSDSFKQRDAHPIVANAEQMLIVASLWAPFPRWGLIDRMLIAAQAGNLVPIVCLNKIDLADTDAEAREQLEMARLALEHYESMGIACLQTSVVRDVGLEALRALLTGKVTVLAGHSGVGKSSLVSAAEPGLEIRVGDVSDVHLKGKHTTTSARRYDLRAGGAVVDTPGVKLFGLWNVTAENLEAFFPDVAGGTAPSWRQESFQRIAASLGG